MHNSSLRIRIGSHLSEVLYMSLLPEAGVLPGGRSKATLSVGEGEVVIDINADDLTALRAAANSFIRWCVAILRCLGEVERDGVP